MKLRDIVFREPPRLMRQDDAERYVGVGTLLKLMQEAGWITAVVARHKMKLFDRKQLDECCDRISLGEFPNPDSAE